MDPARILLFELIRSEEIIGYLGWTCNNDTTGASFKGSLKSLFIFYEPFLDGINSLYNMKRIGPIRLLERKYLFCAMLPLVLLSCGIEKVPETGIAGVWKSQESGWVLQVEKDSSYSFFHWNALNCALYRQGTLAEFGEAIKVNEDTLSLKKGVLTYRFLRTSQFPENCGETLPAEKAADPMYNFEVFSQTITDHYAFLELNNIDWPRLYGQQRSKLSADPTEYQLYTILGETLELINDNHGYLEADAAFYERLEANSPPPETTDEYNHRKEYGDFEVADIVSGTYLSEEMTRESSLVRWGMLDSTTGYVQVKAMWLFADLDIVESRREKLGYVDAYVEAFHAMDEGRYIEREVAGARKAMERAMADLKSADRIVLDIRFNGGGQDAVSFEILRHFNKQRRKVALQKLKGPEGFSPVQELWLETSKTPFAKPVYLLISPQTGSAAETMALASQSLPHFRRIGSNTSGALSTALEKILPNGWGFALSNEHFMDTAGIIYENQGIPADYDLNYPRGRQEFFRQVAEAPDADLQAVQQALEEMRSQE
jgi:hypothetical protein